MPQIKEDFECLHSVNSVLRDPKEEEEAVRITSRSDFRLNCACNRKENSSLFQNKGAHADSLTHRRCNVSNRQLHKLVLENKGSVDFYFPL